MIGLVMTIVGCQSTSDAPREISTNQQSSSQDNAFNEYEKAKLTYDTWLTSLKDSSGLKVYSKDSYSDLLDSWDDAVEIYEEIALDPAKSIKSYSLFSSGSYADAFAEKMAIVETSFNALTALKVIADEVLSDSIAQMNYLDEIEAQPAYPSDYKSTQNTFLRLFSYIEDGELEDAQAKQVLFLTDAKELEIKVVIKRFIAPLKSDLSILKRENFNKIASISFAKAKAEIDSAEQVVKANARDINIITEAVTDARFEIDHVRNVASEVKLLSSVKSDKFEPQVLDFENKLLAISKAIDGSDYRNKSIRTQAALIVDSLVEKQSKSSNELSNKDEKFSQLQQQNLDLKNELDQQLKSLLQTQREKNDLAQQLITARLEMASLEQLVASLKSLAKPEAPQSELVDAKAENVAPKAEEPNKKIIQTETSEKITSGTAGSTEVTETVENVTKTETVSSISPVTDTVTEVVEP